MGVGKGIVAEGIVGEGIMVDNVRTKRGDSNDCKNKSDSGISPNSFCLPVLGE